MNSLQKDHRNHILQPVCRVADLQTGGGLGLTDFIHAAMMLANNHRVLPLRLLFQFLLIKLGIIISGHAQLHSRTDSRALWAEYCTVDIPHNTAT